MKIIFFGLGSIGQRYARILIENYQHDLYAFRSGINDAPNQLGIKELRSWEKVDKLKPDVAFITNPPSLHIETALKCAEISCKLFIEKPIGSNLENLDKLIRFVKEKNLVTYVSYNLRFHPVIKKLKEYMVKQKPLHVRVVCSSYLPNWRPNTDYLNSYSANASMGGGAILDLSHELDYVDYLFGGIKEIMGNFSKVSDITVDAEDYADMLVVGGNIPINIHIDFLSQLKQRYIQIDFNGLTVLGDLIKSEIKEYKGEIMKSSLKLKYQPGQEYNEQINYFFDNIDNPKMMNNLLEAVGMFKKIVSFKNG